MHGPSRTTQYTYILTPVRYDMGSVSTGVEFRTAGIQSYQTDYFCTYSRDHEVTHTLGAGYNVLWQNDGKNNPIDFKIFFGYFCQNHRKDIVTCILMVFAIQ